MPAASPRASDESKPQQAENMQIAACISRPGQEEAIVLHAFALGKALDAPVTLLQVLESRQAPDCPDPVEWDLRRHEARRTLSELAVPPDASMSKASVRLAEGMIADEIKRFATDNSDSLLVIGMQEPGSAGCRGIGSTIHHLLHGAAGYMLLVPSIPPARPLPVYRRILVPVDGSTWAATALPIAVRMAQSNDAELVLAHVIPAPELTETGPYDSADLDLYRSVVERNRRTAETYLDRLRRHVEEMNVRVRVVSTIGRDVRTQLEQMIRTEAVDIVVMSARGHGLSANATMPYGSVAGYLMMHSPAPLLVIPSAPGRDRAAALISSYDNRMPMFSPA